MDKTQSNAKLLTRGGQITFNNLRMLVQVNKKIAAWAIWFTCFMTLLSLWMLASYDSLQGAYYFIASLFFSKIGLAKHVFHFSWHGEVININARGVLSQAYFFEQFLAFLHALKMSFYVSTGVSFSLIAGFSIWLIRRGRKQAEKRFIRGTRIVPPKLLAKAIKRKGASDIFIESVPMIKDFEVRHTLIHGTTGAGKGQTFNQFLDQIRRRGDSAIVFDKGCVFTSLFYKPESDVILNPFDRRCVSWDLWSDAKTGPEFENIAESLIPMHGESDPYWVNAARTVFSETAYRMREDDDRSIKKLLTLLLTAELDVLGKYLKGTQAATLVSDKIEKTAISIRSVISTYLKSLRFLEKVVSSTPFSIQRWVKSLSSNTGSRFMFISSNAEQHASLRPLISMWLSMASISLLSLEENYDRRIWFICDELPSLHKLPQLAETISEIRKFGGCFILGMQSFSQLKKIYGSSSASEIFDLLNTRFFFRSPSSDMAALISKELGNEDIEQSNESYSYGSNTIRDGISIGTQRVTRPLVSPAEIMELPDLNVYLRVPAPVPITKIEIAYKSRVKQSPGFIDIEAVEGRVDQKKSGASAAADESPPSSSSSSGNTKGKAGDKKEALLCKSNSEANISEESLLEETSLSKRQIKDEENILSSHNKCEFKRQDEVEMP